MEALRPTPIKCTYKHKTDMTDKLKLALENRAIALYGTSLQYYLTGITINTLDNTKYKLCGTIKEISLSRLIKWYTRVTNILKKCNIKLFKVDFIFTDAFSEYPEESKIFISYYPNRETDNFDQQSNLICENYNKLCEFIRIMFNFYYVHEIWTIKNNYKLASTKNIDIILKSPILKKLNLRFVVKNESGELYNAFVHKGIIEKIEADKPNTIGISAIIKNIFL